MKKILYLLLALLMLTGCSGQNGKQKPPKTITFAGQTLLDNEQMYLSVNKITESNLTGCVMDVEFRNLTQEDLLISIGNAAVNGCMCNPYFDETVSAGDTLKAQVTFDAQTLEGYGISQVTVIEFRFTVTADHTPQTPLAEQTFTLYPRGEEHKQLQSRKPRSTDLVLMDNDSCSVIVTDVHENSFWGYDLNIYVVNKTDEPLLFTTTEAALNGIFCDPFWTASVLPGKCSNTTMYWFDRDLEDAGITQVDSVTLLLSVAKLSDWNRPFITEPVTFEP